MNKDIQEHLETVRQTGEAVCDAVHREILKLGLQETVEEPKLDEAEYMLSPDPMNGKNSLKGTWRNVKGQKCGEIVFHADGTFYAEYDVVREHPTNRRWFVEGITAWGNDSVVKAEPKLLPVIS